MMVYNDRDYFEVYDCAKKHNYRISSKAENTCYNCSNVIHEYDCTFQIVQINTNNGSVCDKHCKR